MKHCALETAKTTKMKKEKTDFRMQSCMKIHRSEMQTLDK